MSALDGEVPGVDDLEEGEIHELLDRMHSIVMAGDKLARMKAVEILNSVGVSFGKNGDAEVMALHGWRNQPQAVVEDVKLALCWLQFYTASEYLPSAELVYLRD